jgi:hypothetical protein
VRCAQAKAQGGQANGDHSGVAKAPSHSRRGLSIAENSCGAKTAYQPLARLRPFLVFGRLQVVTRLEIRPA